MEKRSRGRKYGIVYSNSTHSIILQMFKDHKRPMTITEITQKLLKMGKLSGSTPNKTVSSILQRSIFVEFVEPGIYRLK